MTYDEYEKQQSDYVPPPMPSPLPTINGDLARFGRNTSSLLGATGRAIANAATYAPPGLRDPIGRNAHSFLRSIMEGAPRGAPQLGQPLPGERLALQMPGVSRAVRSLPSPPFADAGRAAMRGVAGQPLAQLYGPMQNVNNAMMYASMAKTDEERARENTRAGLNESRLAALEPLMMRKYAEKMGYIPTPGVWKRIWRSVLENYTRDEGGLSRGSATPAPR